MIKQIIKHVKLPPLSTDKIRKQTIKVKNELMISVNLYNVLS